MNIFITGTGTDIGKTMITAGLAAVMQDRGLKVGVYKAIQSGAEEVNGQLTSPDLDFVKLISPETVTKCSYLLKTPIAPATAAEIEGIKISKDRLIEDYQELNRQCDMVLVEGAGGLLAPFFDDYLVRDAIKFLNLPVIIVARPDLGTINHTLLTIEATRSHNIDILGVIISKYPKDTKDVGIQTTPDLISKFSGEKILGLFPEIKLNFLESKSIRTIKEEVLNSIDIEYILKSMVQVSQ